MPSIINATTSTGLVSSADNSGSLQLATNNGTTAVTIDTSQNVGIGTTTPTGKFEVKSANNTGTDSIIRATSNNGTASTWLTFNGVSVSSGNACVFHNGTTEQMRLNSSGNLLIGTTSTVDSEKLNLTQSGQFTAMYSNSTNATNAYGIRQNISNYFFNTNSFFFDGIEFSNVRFRVYSNGGIANFQANDQNLSDQREKKNIELAPNYLDKICQIPVKTFLYINQTDTQKTLGVIAQDVQAIAPELVDEADWSENVDGSKMRLSIYQTDLQYALMKAIQELNAKVEAQAVRIAELEGAK
jgi:hypothetical protein